MTGGHGLAADGAAGMMSVAAVVTGIPEPIPAGLVPRHIVLGLTFGAVGEQGRCGRFVVARKVTARRYVR